jgi:hypothetical protein
MFFDKFKHHRKAYKMVRTAIDDLQTELEASYDSGMFSPDLLRKGAANIEYMLGNIDDDKFPAELRVLLFGLRTLFKCQQLDITVLLQDGPPAPCLLSRVYLTKNK